MTKLLAVWDGEAGTTSVIAHDADAWRRRLRRAINRYARAYCENSWKGGGDPDAIPAIERELRDARKALKRLLDA
jgi:hypothetical protein